MIGSPSMTVADVAAEIGRSAEHVQDHWRDMVKRRILPQPIIVPDGGRGAVVWSRAHVYAWLDRDLPAHVRPAVAAYRAALAAADDARRTDADTTSAAHHTARLAAMYSTERERTP